MALVDPWRLYFDNLFDRPGKTDFQFITAGTPVTGYGPQRSVDGARNTSWQIDTIPDGTSLWWDAYWQGDPIRAPGGTWAVALFNHNLRLVGATDIEVQVETTVGSGLTLLFQGSIENMPVNEGDRDQDFVWQTSRTDLAGIPFERLLVRVRFVSGNATDRARVGQVMVLGDMLETRGGPSAPITAQRIANRRLRRTVSGDPAVTPALSQSMPFEALLELQEHENETNNRGEFEALSRLVATQRNGLPYVVHPHHFPFGGQYTGPRTGDFDIDGSGFAWMVSPDGAELDYLLEARTSFTLSGVRQMGVGQWE